MSDLKNKQNQDAQAIQDSLHVKMKAVYSYPSYWSIGGNVAYTTQRHTLGLTFSTTATGARLDYEDYSGIIRVDRKVNALTFGGFYSYEAVQGKRVQLKLGASAQYFLSKIAMTDRFEIYSEDKPYLKSQEYDTHQITFNPNLALTVWPLRFIYLELNPGYRLQVGASTLSGNPGLASPDWSGLYTTLTVGARIGSQR